MSFTRRPLVSALFAYRHVVLLNHDCILNLSLGYVKNYIMLVY